MPRDDIKTWRGGTACGAEKDSSLPYDDPNRWCRNDPVSGNKRCKWHGGLSNPDLNRERLARAEMERMVSIGGRADVDAPTALMEELQRTVWNVRFYERKLQEAGDGSLVWNVSEVEEGHDDKRGVFKVTRTAAVESMYVKLYMRERQQLVQVSRIAIAAGLAQRQVELAEAHATLLAQAMFKFAEQQGIDIDDPIVREQMKRAMIEARDATRAIGGGPDV